MLLSIYSNMWPFWIRWPVLLICLIAHLTSFQEMDSTVKSSEHSQNEVKGEMAIFILRGSCLKLINPSMVSSVHSGHVTILVFDEKGVALSYPCNVWFTGSETLRTLWNWRWHWRNTIKFIDNLCEVVLIKRPRLWPPYRLWPPIVLLNKNCASLTR